MTTASPVVALLALLAVTSAACTHDERNARAGGVAADPPAKSAPATTPADSAAHAPSAGPAPAAPARGAAAVVLTGTRGDATVSVEVVSTPQTRARGLMYRDYLPPDAGMLFLFDEQEQQVFWMKNTLIPLDMIFIRADMTVLGVVENAKPLTTSGRSVPGESRYVLEVNGGWAGAHGIGAGAKARFDRVM